MRVGIAAAVAVAVAGWSVLADACLAQPVRDCAECPEMVPLAQAGRWAVTEDLPRAQIDRERALILGEFAQRDNEVRAAQQELARQQPQLPAAEFNRRRRSIERRIAELERQRRALPREREFHVEASDPASTVDALISRRDITVAQFEAFVLATDYRIAPGCHGGDGESFNPALDWRGSGESSLVGCVTAADAEAYAQWLSRRTNRTYRLPSAAEWLEAASSDARRVVPGGPADNAFPFIAAPLGAISGNRWRWVRDCVSTVSSRNEGCEWHAVRGVSLIPAAVEIVPGRIVRPPPERSTAVGFRVVREL